MITSFDRGYSPADARTGFRQGTQLARQSGVLLITQQKASSTI
jgi:hypothetical protein